MTITQADRDAALAFFPEILWKQAARDDAALAFAAHREAAEARAREEGAKAMQDKREYHLRNVEQHIIKRLRHWEGSERGDAYCVALSLVREEIEAVRALPAQSAGGGK